LVSFLFLCDFFSNFLFIKRIVAKYTTVLLSEKLQLWVVFKRLIRVLLSMFCLCHHFFFNSLIRYKIILIQLCLPLFNFFLYIWFAIEKKLYLFLFFHFSIFWWSILFLLTTLISTPRLKYALNFLINKIT
jgi:hypothetical protein